MRITTLIVNRWKRFRFKNIVKDEFDTYFYLNEYHDVKALGIDPVMHYIDFGWKENRDPNSLFSTSFYIANNPDVKESAVNPFVHFLLNGLKEGRLPNPRGIPYFPKKTQEMNLLSWLTTSKKEKEIKQLRESPLFDEEFYLENSPDIAKCKLDAVQHFYNYGWKENRQLSPVIDAGFLLRMYPEFKHSDINPITALLNGKFESDFPRTVDLYLNQSEEPVVLFAVDSALNKTTEQYLIQLFEWLKRRSKITFKIIVWDNEALLAKINQHYNCLSIKKTELDSFSTLYKKVIRFAGYRTKLIYTNFHLDIEKRNLLKQLHAPILLHSHCFSDIYQSEKIFNEIKKTYDIFLFNHQVESKELEIFKKNKHKVRTVSINNPAEYIINIIRKTGKINPLVSIVVPNYNYSSYLKKRIDSILNQTFQDFELIIIDDHSSDNSVEVIEPYLAHPFIRLLQNRKNSGSVMKQWVIGVKNAVGELVWVAEADDYCEPNFLERTIPAFSDRDVTISYTNSHIIDTDNNITGNYETYYSNLNNQHWSKSYIIFGNEEVNFGLGVKNTIPNASAVVFKRIPLLNTLTQMKLTFVLSGDWYVYLSVLGMNSKIAFCAEKLNYHRKHNSTITSVSHAQENKQLIISEQNTLHRLVFAHFELRNIFLSIWKKQLAGQLMGLYPTIKEESFHEIYPYEENIGLIKQNAERNIAKTIVIISNDSDFSGAPQNILSVARRLHQHYGIKCISFCMREGECFSEFKEYGEAWIIDNYGFINSKEVYISEYLTTLSSKPMFALANTVVTSVIIPQLKKSFIPVAYLLHDYTHSIDKQTLKYSYELSDVIIYSTPFMINKNLADYKFNLDKTFILPQGLYKNEFLEPRSIKDRLLIREQNSIPHDALVVIGCGSVNTRKGVDIFTTTAINVLSKWRADNEIHFLWLGGEIGVKTDSEYCRYLYRDIVNSASEKFIHFIKGTKDVKPYFDASDVFFLTSREDPFPTVVQEAIASGLIVAGFEGTGGAIDLIKKANGMVFPFLDTTCAVEYFCSLNNQIDDLKRKAEISKEIISKEYNFSDYVDNIMKLLVNELQLQNYDLF
jgi:glycosyltransferase involved in cell wall biosynthesis